MTDFANTFRVVVVGQGKRAATWQEAVDSHGWTTSITWGDSVKDDARALLPHAALIDATEAEVAATAGLAVRSAGTYNAVLLFATADDQARTRIRSRVPVPTFVTEKEYMGRLWEIPAARQHQG